METYTTNTVVNPLALLAEYPDLKAVELITIGDVMILPEMEMDREGRATVAAPRTRQLSCRHRLHSFHNVDVLDNRIAGLELDKSGVELRSALLTD